MHEQHEKLEQILASFEQPDNRLLQQQIQQWMAASAENRAYYEEVKRIWFTGNVPGDMEYDIELEKQRFWDRINGETPATPVRKIHHFRKIAIAAIILLAAGIAVWKFTLTNRNPYNILETARLGRDSIVLADGSKIFLHGSSRVRYATNRKGDKREVWLEKGEAYFEITKDPQRPFIVHTDSTAVEVLGTSFDVRIINRGVSVAVATGKVQFRAGNSKANVFLTPGLMGVWNNGDSAIAVTPSSNQLGWRTGVVKFYDAPLTEVMATMEHLYEVKIDIDPALKQQRVMATINNLSFKKIIVVLQSSLDIAITKIDSINYKARPAR